MKTFKEYLTESVEEKIYGFKIKIAGDLPDNCEDVMETCLKKYEVSKFSKSQTTPIQEKLPDFPQLSNSSVTIFDVELKYPTTSAVLSHYVAEQCGLDPAKIKIRSLKEEAEAEINVTNANEETKTGKPLIGQCDPPPSNHQKMAGDKYVASFLKELSKNRKELEQYKGVNDQLLAKKPPKEKLHNDQKNLSSKSPIAGKGKTK
ncbi:hypothetical protein EB118_00180 [bacterium]|nr:hypothetical protein [bacterium]